MGPEGNILVNSPISTFQQGLTHSALSQSRAVLVCSDASVSWVHQSNVLEGKDQLNGQLLMQMRDKELKK